MFDESSLLVVQFDCAEDGHLLYGSSADDSSILLVDFNQNEEDADNSVVVVPFDKCTSSSVFSPELFSPPQPVDLSLQPTHSTPLKANDVVNMPKYISVFSPETFYPPQAVDLSLQPTHSTPMKAIDVANKSEYISLARSRSINVSHLKRRVTFSMEGIMYNCKCNNNNKLYI